MSRRRRRLSWLVLLIALLPGCLAPSYLRPKNPYDDPFRGAYAAVYDAAVVAHGYPLPLMAALKLKPDSVGWNIVTTTAMPVSLVVMLVGGTLALPFVLLLFQ